MDNTSIAIRFDYSEHRKNPEDVLVILSEYVRFYRSIGFITLDSINEKDSALFDLVSLQDGSAIAWIRCRFSKWNDFIFNAAEKLANYLDSNSEILTIEDLDAASSILSESIVKNADQNIQIEPCIDLKQLGKVLSEYSDLNLKLYSDESASIGKGYPGEINLENFKTLNRNFVFNDNVIDMFNSEVKHHKRKSKFYVHVPVNKGHTVWRLEELVTENKFTAKVVNSNWLEDYQSGRIDPIGPKDLMEAIVEYDEVIYKDSRRKNLLKIKNAKVIEIINIVRSRGKQDDFF